MKREHLPKWIKNVHSDRWGLSADIHSFVAFKNGRMTHRGCSHWLGFKLRCVFLCFQQVNEDREQQMERENSFITRWNDKKDTTVSRPCRTQMEITDGCLFVCLCVCVLICLHASGSLKSEIYLNKFPVFLAKNEVGEGGRGVWGGKRALFLLTFTAGTLCLDASAEENIWFR